MLSIKTTKLQEMLNRAVKGAGCNKLHPITSLLALKVMNNHLTITTTDGSSFLYISDSVEADDFYVCVSVDKLPKLISRLTCEDVTLEVQENPLALKVTAGKGTYTIDIPLDEDGGMVNYPDKMGDDTYEKVGEMSVATIKKVLGIVKPALATSMATPQLTNYYVGSTITATDRQRSTILATKVFDQPKLISSTLFDLLDNVIDDTVSIMTCADKIMFFSEHCTVFGYLQDGVESYPIDALLRFAEKDYPSKCKVAKAELLQVLDRISLFVNYLDNDIIKLAFTEKGLVIESRQSNSIETIEYTSAESVQETQGVIGLERLRSQIKSQSGDLIEIHFGDNVAIKMIDNDATLIVALGDND